MSSTLTRRDFVRAATVAAVGASASRVRGANDHLRLGFIGVGNRAVSSSRPRCRTRTSRWSRCATCTSPT